MIKMLSIVCLASAMLLGCGKSYTISSNFNVHTRSYDKVEDIINTVFTELGFDNGDSNYKERKQSYWKWVNDPSGRTFGFSFIVKYTTDQEGVIVYIENTTTASTGYLFPEAKAANSRYRKAANDYLSEITTLIEKRLREVDLKATVETKSSWSPMLKY
jgi:hypothetical protein